MTYKTDWLEQRTSDELFGLPAGVNYLIHVNPIHHNLLADTLDSRIATYMWWRIQGQSVYQETSWQLTSQEHAYLAEHPVDDSVKQVPHLLAIWLTKTVDLGFKLSDSYIDSLFELEQIHSAAKELCLPRFIKYIFEDRADLKQMFNPEESLYHYFGLLTWWEGFGQFEYPRLKWPVENIQLPLLKSIAFKERYLLPRFLVIFYQNRPDVQALVGQPEQFDVQSLLDWWNKSGRLEYLLFKNVVIEAVADNHYQAKLKPVDGLNVVGFAQGVLGLGEDARLVGECCLINDIPVTMINAPIVGPEKLIELKPELSLGYYPIYNTTVFSLPATELMRLALEKGRPLIDHNTYNIGACPWELPNWPVAFNKVADFVDEFWAQSEFVKNCLMKQGDTPTYKMPIAVSMPEPTENVRDQYHLPNDSYLFYLMFDGNSWLTRKNPLAGVQAFQKAFPSAGADKGVGLLIKAMNINSQDITWQKIEKIAQADPRITIISEKLGRQEVVNLMDSCDSYISLHRSEGFGRVIAEAMLLHQPVVATNFSGNVDFCHPDTAFLVDGELVPLKRGDYLFSEGQYWCDPDVDMAADQMRQIYQDRSHSEAVAANAASYIQKHYSVEAVASMQKQRLQAIWNDA